MKAYSRYLMLLSIIFLFAILSISCRVNSNPAETMVLTPDNNNELSRIIITSPLISDVWVKGSKQAIKWVSAESVSAVDLELYRKSQFKTTIVSNLKGKDTFDWIVPSELPKSHHYRIKISNHNRPIEFVFSNYFYILEGE